MMVSEKERDMLATAVERLAELPVYPGNRIATDWSGFGRIVGNTEVGTGERRVTKHLYNTVRYAARHLAAVATEHDWGTINLSNHLGDFADSLTVDDHVREIWPEFTPRRRGAQ